MPILILLLAVLTWQCTFAQSQAAIDKFFEWAKEQNIDSSKIRWPVDFPDTGRGVEATQDIGENEEILRVPANLLLWNGSSVGTPMERLTRKMDTFWGLVIVLLYEHFQGEKSRWYPYLQILPKDLSVVRLWTAKERKELQDPWFEENFKSNDKESMGVLEVIQAYLHSAELHFHLDPDLFVYFRDIVSTRNFYINEEYSNVVCPMGDLFNHHEESVSTWALVDNHFVIQSTSKLRHSKGSQIFINYAGFGDQSNFRSLDSYGFLKLGNQMNTEILYFPEHSPLLTRNETLVLAMRKRLAMNEFDHPESFKATRDGFTIFYQVRGHELMFYMRLISVRRNERYLAKQIRRPASLARELQLAQRCLGLFQEKLDSFPTTIHQDYALWFSPETRSSPRWRVAVEYRIELKKLLLRNLCFCERLLTAQDVRCKTHWWLRRTMRYTRFLYTLSKSM